MTQGGLLPPSFDNAYRGQAVALWIFGAVLLLRLGIAFGTIVNGRGAAQGADGIPLDSFGAQGAAAVVAMFAIWGLAQLALGAIGVLALARYRTMVPLMFAIFLAEHVVRRWLLIVHPIERTGRPPGLWINVGLLAVLAAGLVMSLIPRSRLRERATPS